MTNSFGGQQETRIAEPSSSAVILVGGLGLIGFGLLAASPWLAARALDLPWVPFGGPLRIIESLSETLSWWLLGLIGLAVGAVAGLLLHASEPVITVSDRAIVISKGDQRTRVARSQVAVAAIEDKHLVLRDRADVELAYEKLDGALTAGVTDALARHGWTRTQSS